LTLTCGVDPKVGQFAQGSNMMPPAFGNINQVFQKRKIMINATKGAQIFQTPTNTTQKKPGFPLEMKKAFKT
jgi:hypothetical protein